MFVSCVDCVICVMCGVNVPIGLLWLYISFGVGCMENVT